MMYSTPRTGEAKTAAGDMLQVAAPGDAILEICAVYISQSTEAGDAQSEQVTVSLNRITGSPSSGSGGTVFNPVPMMGLQPAAGTTLRSNATTDLSGGTHTIWHAESFNVAVGLALNFAPGERLIIGPNEHFLLKLVSTPIDSITFDYNVIFNEVGG